MHCKKLQNRGKKLFKIASLRKIGSAAGVSADFIGKVKNGISYLPPKYIPALVAAYESNGITEGYLYTLTAQWAKDNAIGLNK